MVIESNDCSENSTPFRRDVPSPSARRRCDQISNVQSFQHSTDRSTLSKMFSAFIRCSINRLSKIEIAKSTDKIVAM